jgi:hypothetical protein
LELSDGADMAADIVAPPVFVFFAVREAVFCQLAATPKKGTPRSPWFKLSHEVRVARNGQYLI